MIFIFIVLAIPLVVLLIGLAFFLMQAIVIGLFTFFATLSEISPKLPIIVFIGIVALLVALTMTGIISWSGMFWTVTEKIGDILSFIIQKILHARF